MKILDYLCNQKVVMEKMINLLNFWSLIIMIVLCIGFSSCEKDESYPSLTVVNQVDGEIYLVELVGYNFYPLSIKIGQSQTFALDKGMPAGHENVFVRVSCYNRWENIYGENTFNFNNGATTTITLKENGTLE